MGATAHAPCVSSRVGAGLPAQGPRCWGDNSDRDLMQSVPRGECPGSPLLCVLAEVLLESGPEDWRVLLPLRGPWPLWAVLRDPGAVPTCPLAFPR